MSDVITFERSTRRLSIAADSVTTLNEHYRSTLRNALVVAAEKFDANAAEFDALGKNGPPAEGEVSLVPYGSGALRIAGQFRLQALDTRHLIEVLDGDDDAERDTAVLFVANAGGG